MVVVLIARFVAVLRSVVGFIAGANGMPFANFMIANSAGAVAWALFYGLGAYYLGKGVEEFARHAATESPLHRGHQRQAIGGASRAKEGHRHRGVQRRWSKALVKAGGVDAFWIATRFLTPNSVLRGDRALRLSIWRRGPHD